MIREPTPEISLPGDGQTVRWGELYGSSLSCHLAERAATAVGPLLVVTASGREADQVLAELTFFAGTERPPWTFPDRETLPYDPFSPHPDIVSQRLRTLSALPRLRQGLVVTTQAAMLDRLPPRQFLDAHAFDLKSGDRLDLTGAARAPDGCGLRTGHAGAQSR